MEGGRCWLCWGWGWPGTPPGPVGGRGGGGPWLGGPFCWYIESHVAMVGIVILDGDIAFIHRPPHAAANTSREMKWNNWLEAWRSKFHSSEQQLQLSQSVLTCWCPPKRCEQAISDIGSHYNVFCQLYTILWANKASHQTDDHSN